MNNEDCGHPGPKLARSGDVPYLCEACDLKATIADALDRLENATAGDEGRDWDYVFEARDILRGVKP